MFVLFFSSKQIAVVFFFFFSSRRRHTRSDRDWSSDVCSSDLSPYLGGVQVQTLLACDLNGCSGKEGTLGFNAVWNSKKALVTSAHLSKMQEIGRASCRERV